MSLIFEMQDEDVHLIERLKWTWGGLVRSLLMPKHARSALLLLSVIAVSFGLSEGLSKGLYEGLSHGFRNGLLEGLSDGLSNGLSIGLIYWILVGLFRGITNERIEDRFRYVPNEGIRRSFRNGVRMGIISCGVILVVGALTSGLIAMVTTGVPSLLLGGLSEGLSKGLSDGLRYGLNYLLSSGWPGELCTSGVFVCASLSGGWGWLAGVCGGLVVCAMSGGLAALRHLVLRLLLWRTHTFPLNASRFLDDATVRILLRHVGGGYSFAHELILNHFASWDNRPKGPELTHLP